jgi:hypothetical protein
MKNQLNEDDYALIEHAEKVGFVRDGKRHGRVVLHKKDVSLVLTVRQVRDISFPALFLKQYRYTLVVEMPNWYESNQTFLATDNFEEMRDFLKLPTISAAEALAITMKTKTSIAKSIAFEQAVQFDDDKRESLRLDFHPLYVFQATQGLSDELTNEKAVEMFIELKEKYKNEGFDVIFEGNKEIFMVKDTPSVQNPLQVELLKLRMENEG